MAEWQGRTLSKVQIQHRLGRGGMAEVYAGHHTTLHRQVAVKILHAYLADNEALRRRFETEAQAIAALRPMEAQNIRVSISNYLDTSARFRYHSGTCVLSTHLSVIGSGDGMGLRNENLAALRERFIRSISDETVHTKTGRDWSQWAAILDEWDALEKGAGASARYLRNEYELSTWWSNTITARYQWERGLR